MRYTNNNNNWTCSFTENIEELVCFRKEKWHGKFMTILTLGSHDWLIGVQVANLLKRETYNLYRSMKNRGISFERASSKQIDQLLAKKVIKPGTRSLTLIPVKTAQEYISEEIKRVEKRTKNKTKKPFEVIKTKFNNDLTNPAISTNANNTTYPTTCGILAVSPSTQVEDDSFEEDEKLNSPNLLPVKTELSDEIIKNNVVNPPKMIIPTPIYVKSNNENDNTINTNVLSTCKSNNNDENNTKVFKAQKPVPSFCLAQQFSSISENPTLFGERSKFQDFPLKPPSCSDKISLQMLCDSFQEQNLESINKNQSNSNIWKKICQPQTNNFQFIQNVKKENFSELSFQNQQLQKTAEDESLNFSKLNNFELDKQFLCQKLLPIEPSISDKSQQCNSSPSKGIFDYYEQLSKKMYPVFRHTQFAL